MKFTRDRRHSSRHHSINDHGIVHARVRPGRDVLLVNASAEGVLIDAAHRLLPGAPIEVQLTTAERAVSMRGRVLRCSVSRLHASAVWYRAAIGFDRHLPWLVETDRDGYAVLGAEIQSLHGARAEASRSV